MGMRLVEVLTILILVSILGHFTYMRNVTWQSELALLEDCAIKSPGSVRANTNLAAHLIINKDYQKSIKYGLKALSISDKEYYIYYNLSVAYNILDDLENAYKYGRIAAIKHRSELTLYHLGTVLKRMGGLPE